EDGEDRVRLVVVAYGSHASEQAANGIGRQGPPRSALEFARFHRGRQHAEPVNAKRASAVALEIVDRPLVYPVIRHALDQPKIGAHRHNLVGADRSAVCKLDAEHILRPHESRMPAERPLCRAATEGTRTRPRQLRLAGWKAIRVRQRGEWPQRPPKQDSRQLTARAWPISRASTDRTSDASRVTTATVSPDSVVNSTS